MLHTSRAREETCGDAEVSDREPTEVDTGEGDISLARYGTQILLHGFHGKTSIRGFVLLEGVIPQPYLTVNAH
jgi:hypothetical protein